MFYDNPGSLENFPHESNGNNGKCRLVAREDFPEWQLPASHHGSHPFQEPQTRRVGSPVMEPMVKKACDEWSGN